MGRPWEVEANGGLADPRGERGWGGKVGTGRLWETSEWEGEKRWGAGEAWERVRAAHGRQGQGVWRTEGGGGGVRSH